MLFNSATGGQKSFQDRDLTILVEIGPVVDDRLSQVLAKVSEVDL